MRAVALLHGRTRGATGPPECRCAQRAAADTQGRSGAPGTLPAPGKGMGPGIAVCDSRQGHLRPGACAFGVSARGWTLSLSVSARTALPASPGVPELPLSSERRMSPLEPRGCGRSPAVGASWERATPHGRSWGGQLHCSADSHQRPQRCAWIGRKIAHTWGAPRGTRLALASSAMAGPCP